MLDHRDLPEELLQNILWWLKLSPDSHDAARDQNRVLTNTLLSCLLASRTLNRLATPVLYHTVNTDKLFTLAQHLARDHILASHVRELSIDDVDNPYVELMDQDDDREWPEYLRDRLSACGSCWTAPDCPEETSKYGFSIPVSTLVLMMCTNIHTLVLYDKSAEPQAISHRFVEECMDLGYNDPNAPLAKLRNVDLRYPIDASQPIYLDDDDMEPGSGSEGSVWFFWLVQLPQIESISVNRLLKNSCDIPMPSSSGLKRLKVTAAEAPLDTGRLEGILEAFPMLECLDATWKFSYDCLRSTTWSPDKEWAALEAVLTKHGSKLQKLRPAHAVAIFEVDEPPNTPISLASLSQLRNLTLPVEALLSGPAGEYSVPATAEAGHDDEGLEDEQDIADLHAPGHGVNTPTSSLCQLLPHSLQRLRIIDDWNLWADAVRLDLELRTLILDPQFSELRSIRVRRALPWSKHVKDLGWHETRHEPYWNVLLRL